MSAKKATESATAKMCRLLGIDEPYQAPARVMEIVTSDEHERNEVYVRMLDAYDYDVTYDWFHEFYEDENAERKKNKQDFTPTCLARLTSELIGYSDGVVYEPSAGTGGMLISRWETERKRHHPLEYSPMMQWFVAEDMSDRAIPFLLLNLSIRGINANVLHINTLTRQCKAAYLVENARNDMMTFSDVIELPKNDKCMEAFDIREWVTKW